jgi:GntR family transcriptional regulator
MMKPAPPQQSGAPIGRLEQEQRATGGARLDVGVIQRDSPIPFYFQLITYIEEKISSKQWVPGQALPSEEEFGRILGVSRTVVRQAMDSLESKNLIVKHDGKRSSVAYPKFEVGLMQSLRGFHEDAVASGQKPAVRVLGLAVKPAHAEVAEALGLNEGDPVIVLNRLRYMDGEPEGVEVTYLPEFQCPGLAHEDFSQHSLYELLERKYGLEMASGYRTIEAITAEHSYAELLGVKTGSPLLLLKGIGFLADGRRFEYFVARHRGDRSKFGVRVVRDSPSSPKAPGGKI